MVKLSSSPPDSRREQLAWEQPGRKTVAVGPSMGSLRATSGGQRTGKPRSSVAFSERIRHQSPLGTGWRHEVLP